MFPNLNKATELRKRLILILTLISILKFIKIIYSYNIIRSSLNNKFKIIFIPLFSVIY